MCPAAPRMPILTSLCHYPHSHASAGPIKIGGRHLEERTHYVRRKNTRSIARRARGILRGSYTAEAAVVPPLGSR
jgi:hypothetical protein